MITIPITCTCCTGVNLVKNGLSKSGFQRYKCKECQKTFQLKFEKKAYQPGIREQIIEMSLNGSGTRDIARVLGIDKNTVRATLKKNRNKSG
jgi:transposase